MNERSDQAEGITMSSGGIYSLATKGAKDVIDLATPLVLDALQAIPDSACAEGFTFADMGCADGGTSLQMVRNCLADLRSRRAELPVSLVYSDQPRNDFNALATNVHGLGPFETYLGDFELVFPLMSATSFYRQALPPGSLHLGFSATAMHWLSAKPGDISDHVHMVGARGEELARFREQAHADWRRILQHRASELVSGGRLVLVNFCIDDSGRYLGNTGGVNMFDTFNEIWLEFLEDGLITSEEYVGMTLPQYYNSVAEFSAPLTDSSDPVYQAGLRLVDIETRVVPCPFAVEFTEHGDAERFADGYIPTIRTWNESTYANALSAERPREERLELIERYYAAYRQRVVHAPKGHAMDYVHAYMVIEKI